MTETRWALQNTPEDKVKALAADLSVSPLMACLLLKRGLDSKKSVEAFINPSLTDLADPFKFADMGKAVDRLVIAIEKKEKIIIHGDYDADGITATALCQRFLGELGAEVEAFLPGRQEDGYGLREKGIDFALKAGGKLLLSVDCGVTAVAEIAYAQTRGIDVIVTDHHLPGEKLPPAVAVVDPSRPDCAYPYKTLAGVGVAFQLARALADRLGRGEPEKFLDLVALGTVTDVMPLLGENRALVKSGLKLIEAGSNPGLASLKRVAGLTGEKTTAGDLAFVLGPRLNAAGRIGNARDALDLLLLEQKEDCVTLARGLNETNRRRQQEERQAVAEAVERVEKDPATKDKSVLILSDGEWHLGIIGLVASRLAQKYCRPVLVIKEEGAVGRGSARSIVGIDIHGALAACAELLRTYGGHKAAAGFEIDLAQLGALDEKINRQVASQLTPEMRCPLLRAEAKLELNQITPAFMDELSLLEPFGAGNPRPLFLLSGLSVAKGQARVVGREHLRLVLRQGEKTVKAIGFGLGEMVDLVSQGSVHLLGWPEYDEWQGRREVQFKIKDLKVGELVLEEGG